MNPPSSNINKQGISAVKWSALGTVAKYLLQLGAQVLLARLLGPENYGLFATAMVVLLFSTMLADFGFAWGLVQAENITDKDIRFVFTWQLLISGLVVICLNLLAPAIAGFFHEPRIESLVRYLSFGCLLSAASAPATNLLRRQLDFKSINLIQVSSYFAGYLLVGIPLAFLGNGVWSLIAASLVQSLCTLIFTIAKNRHPIKPLFWYEGASRLSGTGATVFATNLCNWFLNNLDRIVIGRFLSPASVGLYVVGSNLANTPNGLLLGALQPAFLATGARIQAEPDRLRKAYLSVISIIWIVITPLFVILALLGPSIVNVLYGSAWDSSGTVLTILALSMPAYITWGMSTPILWNTGKKHLESLLQLPVLGLGALALYYFVEQGIVAIAIVVASVLLGRALAIAPVACRQLNISLSELLPFAARGGVMVILAASGTFIGMQLGWLSSNSYFGSLVGGGLMSASFLLIAAYTYPNLLGDTVINVLSRFYSPLPFILKRP